VLIHDADQGPLVTKLDLANYCVEVGEWILRDAANRPLSLVRCPSGSGEPCFFQKHPSPGFVDAVNRIDLRENTGKVEQYVYVDDIPGLVGLVQMNVIEVHAWGSKIADPEAVDRIVFDLDPGPAVDWAAIVAGARDIRERLQRLGLESFVRTSGGKGLHVVVPVNPGVPWDAAKSFAQAIAATLELEAPERYVAQASKAKRQGRIFVDWLRNSRGSTSIVSYGVRARPGAGVATPLAWAELSKVKSPTQFNATNVARRLARLKSDPWEAIYSLKQSLPGAIAGS
jgi:bifunctional non-homologous end joining protein LigD